VHHAWHPAAASGSRRLFETESRSMSSSPLQGQPLSRPLATVSATRGASGKHCQLPSATANASANTRSSFSGSRLANQSGYRLGLRGFRRAQPTARRAHQWWHQHCVVLFQAARSGSENIAFVAAVPSLCSRCLVPLCICRAHSLMRAFQRHLLFRDEQCSRGSLSDYGSDVARQGRPLARCRFH